MTDSVFDVALEKRFTDSEEIATINVTSADTLLIRDSATGVIMRLSFAALASAISSAFSASFASLIDGKVPASQLPSYVDDVLEYANIGAFPTTGESGKIYVSLATNLTYRWSGSAYVEISASPGSTDAVPEGGSNLYFTNSRARGAVSASGSISYNPTTGVFSFTDAVTSVAGKTGAVTLTKSDVGLNNVDNTSDSVKNSASAILTNKTIQAASLTGNTTVATSVATGGLNVKASATYNDNNNNQPFNLTVGSFALIGINSGDGLSVIPVFFNAGGGIAFEMTALNPSTGAWIHGTGISFSFTAPGTHSNTYTIQITNGAGQVFIQRTSGSSPYTIYYSVLFSS